MSVLGRIFEIRTVLNDPFKVDFKVMVQSIAVVLDSNISLPNHHFRCSSGISKRISILINEGH
jgi:hypothetical protein